MLERWAKIGRENASASNYEIKAVYIAVTWDRVRELLPGKFPFKNYSWISSCQKFNFKELMFQQGDIYYYGTSIYISYMVFLYIYHIWNFYQTNFISNSLVLNIFVHCHFSESFHFFCTG